MATASGFDETAVASTSTGTVRTPDMTNRNLKGKPAALIVCERWETFLQGGVGGAVSLLAGLFQALGMVIFCTLLKTSPRINQEAKDLDISLKLPSMDARGRYTEPEPNWLPAHEYYYPKLGEIENVKMVVGFGMSTSDAASRIREDVFKDANFQMVNLWDHDLLSEHSLGYSKNKFNTHCDFFREDSKAADVITSIGLQAHHDFSFKHRDHIDKHFKIQTFPQDRYFKLSPPKLSDNGQVRILSFLEKCDIKELSNLLVLAKAINGVTETCINSFDSPPKWRIVGVPEGREEEIEKRLKPHAKLEIFCIPFQSLEQLEKELQCAHIVLIPPKALNSLDFALTAMAIGVPVYVPVRSPCHYFLKEYNMLDYERDITVDMNGGTKKLQEKIMYAIKKYSVVSKKLNQIKELLRTQVKQEVDKTNAEFVKELSKLFDNSVSKGCIEKRTDAENHSKELVQEGQFSDEKESQCLQVGAESSSKRKDCKASEEDESEQICKSSIRKTKRKEKRRKRSKLSEKEISSSSSSSSSEDTLEPEGRSSLKTKRKSTKRKYLSSASSSTERDSTSEGTNTQKSSTSYRKKVSEAKYRKKHKKPAKSTPKTTSSEEHQAPTAFIRRTERSEEKNDDMKNMESDSGKRTTSMGSDDSRERPRIKGEIKVNMDIKEAVPAEGSSDEISNFKRDKSEIEKELAETMKKLNKLHAELLTLGNGEGSISFIMKCKSLGALECLMAKYSGGQLHEMMEDTMITPNLMDVLGVKYLKLQVTIDMEEFKLCKAELGDVKGKYRRNSTSLPCDVTFNVTGSRIPHTPLQSLHLMLPNVAQYQDSCMVHLANDIDKLSMDGATKMLLGYGDIPLLGRQRARLMKERKHKKLNIMLLSGMSAARDSSRKSGQTQTFSSQAENDDQLLQDFIHLREKVEAARKIKDALSAENFQLWEENVLEDAVDTPSIFRQEIQRKDELIVNIQSKVERVQKGIVPKDTVRRLSRQGNGPGEVWQPWGLTINHNEHVVVSDYGVQEDDEYDEQPGSVKTVTADTAQIISTITFHDLPNIFRPTDVKMSKNNLYYIADGGNNCILVCDAKSRLKQIIDLGEVDSPEICLGPDNTVFVADYNGRVIKYSKAGEMISSKQLSSPWYLTMNSKYQLIVSSEDEHCIYVLDSNLNTLHTFGHEHLVDPLGVSVDAIGENIYVADENKVKIFSAQGEYLTDVTVDGKPSFIAVFADGRIVYKDYSDGTVRVIYT